MNSLKYFGLKQISDLPKPREIEEIMKDEDFIEQKRRIMMSGVEKAEEEELQSELERDNEIESELKEDNENTIE